MGTGKSPKRRYYGFLQIAELIRRMILMLKCDKCGRFIAKPDAHVKEIPYYLSTDQEVLCGRCAKTDFGEQGGKKDPRSQKYAL